MKIVYCIFGLYNPGGMQRVLTQKVNYLSSVYNYDITIITTEQNNRPIFFELDERVKVVHFPLIFEQYSALNLYQRYKNMRNYKRLLQDYLIRNPADICISLCGKELNFLTSLKDQSKKIAEIHSTQDYRKQRYISLHKNILWRWVGAYRTQQLIKDTKKLSKLIVLTKEDQKKWEKTHRNISQIYNPYSIITEHCSSLCKKRFIAVGHLSTTKGFDYLIPAWGIVAQKYPDWKLDIYGKGEWHDWLLQMIKEKGLENMVSLKGVTTNVEKEYLDSSGCVMTSRYEGFPLVLLEAMSCGLPLVSFDCTSGPKEIIQQGENGYLVPVGDIQALADRICRIIEDEELRKSMGIKSKQLSSQYQVENIMKQWVNLFQEIVSL